MTDAQRYRLAYLAGAIAQARSQGQFARADELARARYRLLGAIQN